LADGIKHDMQKLRVDLLPPDALLKVSQVLTYGATKYGDRNWEGGMEWNRLYGAALRHLLAWQQGEDLDPESKLSHIAHATANLMFLLAYHDRSVGQDNRPPHFLELKALPKVSEPVLQKGPLVVDSAATFLPPSPVVING
jgi:hypothetical protein